jgi:hypothetical protein
MKANNLWAAIGSGIVLSLPLVVVAQTTPTQNTPQQSNARQANTATQSATTDQNKTKVLRRSGLSPALKSGAAEQTKTEGLRRSGLPPAFLDQNDGGNHFTDSTMRSMTRAGDLGVETGTFGSDSNGQIGTTNQNNMVYYPLSYQGSFLTFHFGSGGSPKPAPVHAHRSPRPKNTDSNKSNDSNKL